MAVSPPPPNSNNPTWESLRGVYTDANAWLHRRGGEVSHAAHVTKAVGRVLHQRYQLHHEHRKFRAERHHKIRHARNAHVEEAHRFITQSDELKKKKKTKNVRAEIRAEIAAERKVIDAHYRAKRSQLHLWDIGDWGAIIGAKLDHAKEIGKHKLKVVGSKVWVPGVRARQQMYRDKLKNLSAEHLEKRETHKREVAGHHHEIKQHRSTTRAKRPSLREAFRMRRTQPGQHNS